MQTPGSDEAPSDEAPSAVLGAVTGDPAPDSLVHSAWRSWLSALATDAEAAMAAALAYESLPPEARDAWLDALDTDRSMLDVPAVALYAPLLAVESERARRERIGAAIAREAATWSTGAAPPLVLRGVAENGVHACVIVAPLYLDFVQVLHCQYTPSGGFVAVRHDPLRHADDVSPVLDVDGVAVEKTPLRIVVEELAHAILADKRAERESPQELASFVHLFAPDFEDTIEGDRSL
jgi:hypothetical protein